MVRLLLDHGVDVNAIGGRFGTAMAAVITMQSYEMIKLLGECGANILLQAPGSPMPGYDRWGNHRNPFSRSRVGDRALPVDRNLIENTAPIRISGPDAKVVIPHQPAPNDAEMTDSADGSAFAYNEITMSDQDFQLYPTCEVDRGYGDGAAVTNDDD